MKVYLDENLSSDIACLLRAKGVDAVSAHEVRRRQVTDRAQLDLAMTQDRVIVTADVVDFVALSRQAIAANSRHAGINPDGLRGLLVYLRRAPRA